MSSKSKMISFRLSDQEYLRLREACRLLGANSVSEMARMAMQRLISVPDGRELGVQEQVRSLHSKLDDLTLELNRLSKAVGAK